MLKQKLERNKSDAQLIRETRDSGLTKRKIDFTDLLYLWGNEPWTGCSENWSDCNLKESSAGSYPSGPLKPLNTKGSSWGSANMVRAWVWELASERFVLGGGGCLYYE